MKRIKLVFGLALFCAMTFGALKAYDYTHTTESEKLLLANVEALTQSEDGEGDSCPNGGYFSNGRRTSNSGTEYELIKFKGTAQFSVEIFPTYQQAAAAGKSAFGFTYEIKAFMWVEYDCDRTGGNCMVCNRYRV